MEFRRLTIGLLVTGAAAGGIMTAPAATAEPAKPVRTQVTSAVTASPDDEVSAQGYFNCKKKSAASVLKVYTKKLGKGRYGEGILRCGTSKWGYRHFEKRVTKSFHQKIVTTFKDWDKYYTSGNTTVYCRKYKTSKAKYWFKIVYSSNDVPGKVHGVTGVVTSTWQAQGGACDKKGGKTSLARTAA